jgi:murein DD-endopeptidase MepM/ murein hydrolase activator NlpD
MSSALKGWMGGRHYLAAMIQPRRNTGREHMTVRAIDHLGRAFGGILMIGASRPGLLILAALTVEPIHLVGALLGLLVADGYLRAIGNEDPALAPMVRANAILSAVAAAWLVAPMQQPLHVAAILILLASGAATVASAALASALASSAVPPLSAAFAITFGILLMLLPHWAQQAVLSEPPWPYPIDILGWLDSFMRSMGMILFSPRPETGLFVLAALFLWSRALVLSGIVGWISGILAAEALAGFGFQWLWLMAAHNGFIAGMLLGAVFHLPNRAALVISAVAGVSASVLALALQTGFSGTGWAFQPLPALITVWIGLLAVSARAAQHPLITTLRRDLSPEQAWRQAALAKGRFGAPEPLVAVPLAGVVTISQSFDGPFSHRGAWRHGLDFELPADMAPRGSILGAPIYCPTAGVVELVGDGVADNPLGVSNYSQNWGNYIIIRMDHGGWLMMAHLAQGSIGVVPGQRVAIGQPLATVGNSGRSPIPHLHLHVQSGPLPGAPTLPFKLANYVQGSTSAMTEPVWIRAGVPESSSFIRAALNVPASFRIAAGLAPGAGLWRITTTDTIPARFSGFPHTEYLSTTLDSAGNHCVADSQGGQLVMRADADGLRVYSIGGRPSPVLLLWSMALPVLPYCAVPGLSWSDRIDPPPITLLDRIESLAAPYLSRPLAVIRLICTAIADGTREDMVVEAQMLGRRKNFPVRVTVRLASVKGPIAWEAHFEKGSILAELVSFGPLSADETAALN